MTLIYCVPKSPHSSGRIGPRRLQDWYRAAEKAAAIARCVDRPVFLVHTAFQAADDVPEADIYVRTLRNLAPNISVVIIRQGMETTGQLESVFSNWKHANEDMIMISTFLHYPRVRWLTRRKRVRHIVAWGIPRPYEALTDIVLIVLFPVIDLVGLRDKFLHAVLARRQKGTL